MLAFWSSHAAVVHIIHSPAYHSVSIVSMKSLKVSDKFKIIINKIKCSAFMHKIYFL